MFDPEKKGYLDSEQLKELLTSQGEAFSNEEVGVACPCCGGLGWYAGSGALTEAMCKRPPPPRKPVDCLRWWGN